MRKYVIIAAVMAALIVVPFAAANGNGGGHTPVTVCHKPGTSAEHTLTFDDDALWAHLAHGDTLGECAPPPQPPVCPEGTTEYSTNPLVCLKTVTNTVEVPVPGPTVYVDKPGPTVYVDVPGPTVYVDVPGPATSSTHTEYVIKYKTKVVNKIKTKVRVKVVYRTKIKTIIKRPICKIPGVHPNGVEGAG